MLHKTKSLLSLGLIALLPGLALAALAGANYGTAQTIQQQRVDAGLAPSASAIAAASGGSTAAVSSSGGSSSGAPPSQKGNTNAVSAILHPAPKEGTSKNSGPPEPMDISEVEGRVMDISINSYSGRCACPYSRNADGFECGVEAAYYKPGGFRIYCFPEDVRGQLNIFYRKTH